MSKHIIMEQDMTDVVDAAQKMPEMFRLKYTDDADADKKEKKVKDKDKNKTWIVTKT